MNKDHEINSWDTEWETIHQSEEWGKYPSEHAVRFISRNFKHRKRSEIRILEIGCGAGAQVWFLAREGYLASGIDGSSTAITKAKKRLEDDNLTSNLIVGDVINLDFPDGYFDAVLDIECLMGNKYLNSIQINESVCRVLKKGGLYFSQTFSTNTNIGEVFEVVEENTYNNIKTGNLARNRLIRLLPENSIRKLYGMFDNIQYERVTISSSENQIMSEEWLITCKKEK
jgi:ubiquinone/menaquinone biosynthesis C-methylase UbiE